MNRAARRASARRRLAIMRQRPCGECDACCTRLAIPELDKPPEQRCGHQAPVGDKPGCMAYADRPPSCRAFECAWRRGYGGPEDRPDRSGVMYLESPEDPAVMVAYDLATGVMGRV